MVELAFSLEMEIGLVVKNEEQLNQIALHTISIITAAHY